jgi:Tol biopolymer transport system component
VYAAHMLDAIWVVNSDGTGRTRVLQKGNAYLAQPGWSPDGNEICFAGRIGNKSGLWLMRKDGANLRHLINGAGGGSLIFNSWSPSPAADGNHWIAFMDNWDARHDIWLVRPDGTGLTNLTASTAGGFGEVDWAPDGRRLVTLDWSAGLTVLEVGLAGGRLGLLGATTIWAGYAYGPRWANADDRILFYTLGVAGLQHDLAWVDAAQPFGPIHFVTNTADRSEQTGDFAPDDSRVLYERVVNGGLAIFTARLDGTNEVQVATKARHPRWRRF